MCFNFKTTQISSTILRLHSNSEVPLSTVAIPQASFGHLSQMYEMLTTIVTLKHRSSQPFVTWHVVTSPRSYESYRFLFSQSQTCVEVTHNQTYYFANFNSNRMRKGCKQERIGELPIQLSLIPKFFRRLVLTPTKVQVYYGNI